MNTYVMDPKNINKKALSILDEMNEGFDLEIEELFKKPPYFGWVKLGKFPRYIYLNGMDDGIALKWLWNWKYEHTSIMAWRSLSDHADVILDIGAHTGSYTLIASLNKRAKVYAFEPMPMTLARLVMNLQYNKTTNVKVSPLAVSDSVGKVFMSLYISIGFLTTGQSISYDSLDKGKIKIDSVSLDNFLRRINAKGQILIKIDVEGKEADVLLGSHQLLKRRPVLILECINAESGKRCTDILQAEKYCFYLIDDKLNTITKVRSIKPELLGGNLNKSKLNRLVLPIEKEDIFLNIVRSKLL